MKYQLECYDFFKILTIEKKKIHELLFVVLFCESVGNERVKFDQISS